MVQIDSEWFHMVQKWIKIIQNTLKIGSEVEKNHIVHNDSNQTVSKCCDIAKRVQ